MNAMRIGFLSLVGGLIAHLAQANNLVVTNLTLSNAGGGAADLAFDLSWDNSWHESWQDNGDTVSVTNWDAVWLFAKVRQSGGNWRHLHLADSGHAPAGGLALEGVEDGAGGWLGAFARRAVPGSGPVNAPSFRLHWDYAADGLVTTNELDLVVLGIEMVLIPEGAFVLGSGGNEAAHFYEYPDPGKPYAVASEAAITLGVTPGSLQTAGSSIGLTLEGQYPKGFKPFYCMKYEMSQGQYADFLNLLDPAVAATRIQASAYGGNGYSIHRTNDAYVADAPDRACSYLDHGDITAYLDWAGLRLMTELEFEKACRGVRAPYIDEFVWGTTAYVRQTSVSGTEGSGTETALPASANCNVASGIGLPTRCGIFATAASSREQAGAGYYGVMNLADNLQEVVITAASLSAQNFAGSHGDGNLLTPLPADWPANPAFGFGARGAAYNTSDINYMRTSFRAAGNSDYFLLSRSSVIGLRGVRTVSTP